MSLSPTIDSRYRLTPRDLGRRDHLVTIQNVSWQGVETLTLLLHLREFPTKRLVLDAIQQQELIHIVGTYHTTEWIGRQILIAAQSDSDQLRIHLFAVTAPPQKPQLHIPTEIPIPENIGATVILLLILLLLFLLVALLEQSDSLLGWF
ncbi:MAG: hypothetical protein KDE53_03590 [Caldilineaceae bacterium]|nr:hypothetical protein [Caldilineaceae bacterium]